MNMDLNLIGPLFCQVCKVAIPHENARDSHNQGKRHQLALHLAYMEDNNQKASVFSRGWPNAVNKDRIAEFMATYGEVDSNFIAADNAFVITQYKDPAVAQQLINTGKVKFYDRKITLTAKKRAEKQLPPPPTQEFDPILRILFNQTTLDAEIATLAALLQPEVQTEVQKYLKLCYDLEVGLQAKFQFCKVHPFGSTITGLAFRDSDVDAFIFVPNPPANQAGVPFYRRAVNMARDCLSRNPLFTNLLSIPRAKTPIVKCVHKPTGIKCDFNFKNMLGVCNSYFIQFFTRLDPKFKPCLLIIKFWAKIRQMTEGNTRFTNYALIIMFLFYLQQEPFNFPSIRKLQENPSSTNLQDGWNGGFDRNFPIDVSAFRKVSNFDLLMGFFKFYANFDYNTYVISPYLGKIIDKKVFEHYDTIPNEFQRYRLVVDKDDYLRIDALMCLQDPFEHNRNLTGALHRKFFDEYIDEIRRAFDIFEAQQAHMLYHLCNEEYKNVTQHVVRIKMPKQKDLLFLCEQLDVDDGHQQDKAFQLKTAWFGMMQHLIMRVLRDVFMFNMNEDPNEDDAQSHPKKMKSSIDILNSLYETVTLTGSTMYNLWDARWVIRDDIKMAEGVRSNFDRQVEISKYIVKILLKDVLPKQSIVNISVTIENYIVDTHVIITMKSTDHNDNDNNYYDSFASCFCKVLSGWVALYCRDNNRVHIDANKVSVSEADVVVVVNHGDNNIDDKNKETTKSADV